MKIRFAVFVGALVLLLLPAAMTGVARAETPSPLQVTASPIHITSPTGASSWSSTSTQIVSWTMLPAVSTGEVRVSLLGSADARYNDQRILAVADQTDYSVVIAVGAPAGFYKAQVSWRPTVGSGDWEDTATSPAFMVYSSSPCWRHALQILAKLRAQPPRRPLVLFTGDSTVRESTINDVSLTRAIYRLSGRRVIAHNIASSNAGFNKDLALVPFMPKRRTVVFIGVNLIRFISPGQPAVKVKLPRPAPIVDIPHAYSVSKIHTPSEKRAEVVGWVKVHFPHFDARFAANLASLDQLIVACQNRGLRPVLLEAPRNTAAIRSAWDGPVGAYHAACVDLAAKRHIPYVDFVRRAHFVTGDFFDVWHAVEPGRVKYQALLSASVARWVARYFPAN